MASNTKRKFLDQAILLGIASTVFVGVRIMAVSRGNLVLAETLLSNLDPFKIFISSMMPLANLVCILLGGFIFYRNHTREKSGTNSHKSPEFILSEIAAGLLLILGIVFANMMSILGFLLFCIIQLLRRFFFFRKTRLMEERSRYKTSRHALYYDVAVLTSAVFIFYTFLIPTMWVPTENIYVKHSIYGLHSSTVKGSPITAYVISSDPNYLTTIDSQYLTPELYKTSDVLGRQICSEDDHMIFEAFLSWSIVSWYSKTLGQVWRCKYPSNISAFWQSF